MTDIAEKVTALPPELQQLQSEAEALATETAPAAAVPEGQGDSTAAAPVDYLGDAQGLVNIAAESLAAFYPSTAAVLTDDKRSRIAGALAPILEKYGWDMGSIFGKFGAEIGLAFALSQVAIPLSKAIKADRAAAAATEATQPAPVPPAAPSPATKAAPPGSDLYAKA